MLQSIQFLGSGPPTYVYSKKAVGASYDFYHVFAAETRGYDARKEEKERKNKFLKKKVEEEYKEPEESMVLNDEGRRSVQEVYEKEYGRRESFLWRLR